MPQTPQRYEMYQTADGLIHHPSHHHARFRSWYTGWYTLCERGDSTDSLAKAQIRRLGRVPATCINCLVLCR